MFTIHQNLKDKERIFPIYENQNILFSQLEDSALHNQLPAYIAAQYVQYVMDMVKSDWHKA